MARYKRSDASTGQGLFLTVRLQEQLLPGTFEYMLNEIIDTKIDTSIFDKKYKNDKTGASAIPPAVLLKLVVYAYSKGLLSSREIWALSRENMVAKALTGDMPIHWTTISSFISENSQEFREIFGKVLAYCNELGLIGGETFAIDGCRLPSNASKEFGGTLEGLQKRLALYERMADKHLAKHMRKDERGENDTETNKRAEKRQEKLKRQIERISAFLETMEKKKGKRGQEVRSNVTDNESALIRTPSGYIQGYIGLAVADAQTQVVVGAQAVGSANECEHFPEMLGESFANLREAGVQGFEEEHGEEDGGERPKRRILADKNYFSEENLEACARLQIEGIIPDSQARKSLNTDKERKYVLGDFRYHREENAYTCPQGKKLCHTKNKSLGGKTGEEYRANVEDCRLCSQYGRCIRSKKEQSELVHGKTLLVKGPLCRAMREKFEQEEYKEYYDARMQIIEPVFAHIRHCKGLGRFTLRGRTKVHGQWLLYCIVHNLCKCLSAHKKMLAVT